jgi:predicted amidophosphoribosyltransferase
VNAASWAADFTDLLLPAGCISCGIWVPGGAAAPLVCARCRTRLKVAPWPRCERCHFPSGTGRTSDLQCRGCRDWPAALSAARYAYVLAPPADDLVHALKYEGWPELAPLMASAMTPLSVPSEGGRVLVVPVPTTATRLRARGYNQAGLLAEGYARARSLALAEPLLRAGTSCL